MSKQKTPLEMRKTEKFNSDIERFIKNATDALQEKNFLFEKITWNELEMSMGTENMTFLTLYCKISKDYSYEERQEMDADIDITELKKLSAGDIAFLRTRFCNIRDNNDSCKSVFFKTQQQNDWRLSVNVEFIMKLESEDDYQ